MSSLSQYFTMQDVVAITSGAERMMFYAGLNIDLRIDGSVATETTHTFSYPIPCLRFLNSAFRNCSIRFVPPPKWNGGNIRWRYYWAPTTTAAGNVNFNMIPQVFTDNETLDASSPAIGGIGDTNLGSTTKLHISPWATSTLGSVASPGDMVFLKVYGRGGAAEWTTTAQADVIAVEIELTTNAPTDD